jgi:5'-nucleotidase
MKNAPVVLWILLLVGVPLGAEGTAGFRLTILHVNDTHQMVEPQTTKLHLVLPGETEERPIQAELGGLARTAAVLQTLEARETHPLVLHAGDFHHRKFGTADYTVAQDAALWGRAGLDAAALGNNDVDGLGPWLDLVTFPVLAANGPLADFPKLAASTVKSYGIDQVGVVGITTGGLDEAVQAVQTAVDALRARGITKVVAVSHLGYDDDLKLAGRVTGIGVVVGGHSHTFLGNWRVVGQGNHESYPTVVKGSDGRTVLVVQAGEFGEIVGDLRVDFDPAGRVTGWEAAPVAVVGGQKFRIGDLPGPDGTLVRIPFVRNDDGSWSGPGVTDISASRPVLDNLERALEARPDLAVSSAK